MGRVVLLLLCLALVAGCASLPWADKGEEADLADQGKVEAQLLSEQDVLAIVRQGDVWLVPGAGGDAIRVTYSGRAANPSVSPDGLALAYVLAPAPGDASAQAELRVMVLDTGETVVAATGAAPWGPPSWAPDGTYLAWPVGDVLRVLEVPSGVESATYAADLPSMGRPAAVWSADSATLYYPLVVDGQVALYALPNEGDAVLLSALDPAVPPLVAVSADGRLALWQPGALQIIDLDEPEAEVEPVTLPETMAPVLALGWSPDGASLALVDATGSLWVDDGDGFGEAQYQAAGLSGVRWLSDEALTLWQSATPGVEMLVQVDASEYAATVLSTAPVETDGPQALYADLPVASTSGGATAAALAYDWYRYQGAADSGPYASTNCGPTSVAMAIQFHRDNLQVPISEIRTFIGGSSWTYAPALQSALSNWQVPSVALGSMAGVDAALDRGNIVLAHVWMSYISRGTDTLWAYSSPAQNTGRYTNYELSHWVVIKGVSADGQWLEVYDPDVWPGNGVYWYSDGTPKGRDRLYRYSELAAAIAAYDFELIEVAPSGGTLPDPTPTSPAPTTEPADGFWYTVRPGDTLWAISRQYGTTIEAIVDANGIANPNLIYVGQILWIPAGPTPTAEPGTPTVTVTVDPGPTATTDPYPGPTATTDPYPGPTATTDPYPGPTAITDPYPGPTGTIVPTTTLTPTLTLVPTETPDEPGVWYTVTWGDTLDKIAARYGVTVQAIAEANSIANPNLIRLGQRLWIPLAGAPPTATPTVTPTAGPTFEYVVQRGDTLSIIATRYGTTWQVLAQINGLTEASIIYPGQKLLVPAVGTPTATATATGGG